MILRKIGKGTASFIVLIICCVLLMTSVTALADYYPGPEEKPEDPVVVPNPQPKPEPAVVPPQPTQKPVINPQPRPPKPKEEYTLTVYYQYMDGSTAAQTYSDTYAAGTSFNIHSPSIEGQHVTRKNVNGIMPKRSLAYVVYYYGDQVVIEILEEYDTPLGLGSTVINIGDCYE